MTMYRVVALGIEFAPCHTEEFARLCAKGFQSASVVKLERFLQPVFTIQHEWNLLKLLRA